MIGVQASCGAAIYGVSIGVDAGADTSTVDGNTDVSTNDSAVAIYGAAPAQLEQTPLHDAAGAPPPRRHKI